ncbi:MAG: hypothetical protein PUJ07_05430 [Eubacteriales bacterium]|nr:hypothetical protein [Eubacteriales bacterium]MDY2677415.1 hypothetical protein [Oscillospiraceae bacterium]
MKAKALLSATTGFFFGLFTYLVLQYLEMEDALLISVFGGLLFYLLLFIFFLVYGKMMDKKYAEFEKEITSPIFYKTNGNFNLGNGKVKNGNIYFCEAGIVCLCLDEKPYTLDEILLQDVDHYQFDDIHLNIFTKDERVFVITLSDAKNVIKTLREKDWIVF